MTATPLGGSGLPSVSWEIRAGDCRELLRDVADESVQACITSPPYLGLRDYGHESQVGLEDSVDEYVEALVETFREVRRVLRDDGTLWLNLGDSYNTRQRGSDNGWDKSRLSNPDRVQKMQRAALRPRPAFGDTKSKDLLGVPWMVAFALRSDGWWLREDIVWAKTAPMPESVTDRCTRSHEFVFRLTKSARYYADQAAIREPDAGTDHPRSVLDRPEPSGGVLPAHNGIRRAAGRAGDGRNKRSVWTVGPAPYRDAHFATFPPKLVEPMVLASTRPGDLVLDPFAGAGTTGLVALRHERSFVGLELNPEYVELARRRIVADAPLLNAHSEVAA